MRLRTLGLMAVVALAPAARGLAASATFALGMTGANEVLPTVGDPDGFANGTITLDDVSGMISWNITYGNLDPTLSGFHIHGPASASQSAGILIGLGTATTGGPGTLISSIVATPANVAQVLGNPSNFYVNIHTQGTFAGGAVRDQLGTLVPEPATAALVACGLAAIGACRRRR